MGAKAERRFSTDHTGSGARPRRLARRLGAFVLWGWLVVAVLSAYRDAYARENDSVVTAAGLAVVGGLWLLVILGRAARVHPGTHPAAPKVQRGVARWLARLGPLPSVRLTVLVVAAPALWLVVQDLAAAAAGALHVGSRATYLALVTTSGGRGSYLSHGVWTSAGVVHEARLMDGVPATGASTAIRVPPLGGASVYRGGPLAWFACLVLVSLLVGYGWLLRSTAEAVTTVRAGRTPQRRGRSGGLSATDEPASARPRRSERAISAPPLAAGDVVLRPHASTERQAKRKYFRTVSYSVRGDLLVIVGRTGREYVFPITAGKHDPVARAIACVTAPHTSDKAGTYDTHLLLLLDQHADVLAVLDDTGLDRPALAEFCQRAGLRNLERRLPTEAMRDAAYPIPAHTPHIEHFGGPALVLSLLGCLVGGGIVLWGAFVLSDRFGGRYHFWLLCAILACLPFVSAGVAIVIASVGRLWQRHVDGRRLGHSAARGD